MPLVGSVARTMPFWATFSKTKPPKKRPPQHDGAALLTPREDAQLLPHALPCVHRAQDDLKKPDEFESGAFEALESNFQEVAHLEHRKLLRLPVGL
jgi:hypothetical protein